MKEPPDPLGGLLGAGAGEGDAAAEDAGAGAELTELAIGVDGAGAAGVVDTEGAATLVVAGCEEEWSFSGAITLVALMAGWDGEAITAGEEVTTAIGGEEAITGGAEEAKPAARDE